MDGRRETWRIAMSDALYGEAGFYLTPGAPGRHFRTAVHASPLWAEAVHRLGVMVAGALGCCDRFTVLDMGAGGGELLTALGACAPPAWRLVGVDRAPRPPRLPARVEWLFEPPAPVTGLVLANEWLDVVPVEVVELDHSGPRYVTVAADGSEALGDVVAGDDLAWLQRWWPLDAIGHRAEVGRFRDAAWHDLTGRLDRGLAVAVDYSAVPGRDAAGTLTGYRAGRQVPPVPDGSCDLTAHVLVESLVVPGDVVLGQREALAALGLAAALPSYDGTDPAAYLAALSDVSRAAQLVESAGLGGFTWLLHPVGIPSPLRAASHTVGRPHAPHRKASSE